MSKNNGGSAFPAEGPSPGQFESPGMTLRDFFAAKALPLVADTCGDTISTLAREIGIFTDDYKHAVHWPVVCAMRAYRWADAMLSERDK